MNLPEINCWFAIAKRIIRSSERRQRDEKQNKLTKYINLTTMKTSNSIQITVNQPDSQLIQPSITTFIITKPASIRDGIKFLPTVQNSKQRKRIMQSSNNIGNDPSYYQHPSEARPSTVSEIPLTIATALNTIKPVYLARWNKIVNPIHPLQPRIHPQLFKS